MGTAAIRTQVWICTHLSRTFLSFDCLGRVFTDRHTPYSDLMVKDGLLSPNSKLVQGSRGTTPLPGDRPGSVFSVASTGTRIAPEPALIVTEDVRS